MRHTYDFSSTPWSVLSQQKCLFADAQRRNFLGTFRSAHPGGSSEALPGVHGLAAELLLDTQKLLGGADQNEKSREAGEREVESTSGGRHQVRT